MAEKEQEVPDGASAPDLSRPDLAAYAQDLITVWQSELSALAADREMHEGFQRGLAMWGAMAQSFAQSLPKSHSFAGTAAHEASRRSGSAAPPRSAPTSDASDARDEELARLAKRVAELERRLAEFTGLAEPDKGP